MVLGRWLKSCWDIEYSLNESPPATSLRIQPCDTEVSNSHTPDDKQEKIAGVVGAEFEAHLASIGRDVASVLRPRACVGQPPTKLNLRNGT